MPMQSGKFEVPHVECEKKATNGEAVAVEKVPEDTPNEAADTVIAEMGGDAKAEDKPTVETEKTEETGKKGTGFMSWINKQKKKATSLKRKPKGEGETPEENGVTENGDAARDETKPEEPSETPAEKTTTEETPAENVQAPETTETKEETATDPAKKNVSSSHKISTFMQKLMRKASKREKPETHTEETPATEGAATEEGEKTEGEKTKTEKTPESPNTKVIEETKKTEAEPVVNGVHEEAEKTEASFTESDNAAPAVPVA